MKRKLIRLSALLVITALIALGLCSCTMKEDSAEAREICEDYFDAVIANDFAAAYDIFDEVADADSFKDVWIYTRDVLENSQSYELKQVGWYTETDDGVTFRQITFEIESDDEKTMYATVILDDQGIYSFNVLDSTEFINNTVFVRVIGVIMTVISFALFGVTIWMIVDACKRKIKHKALWILLIIIGVWFEVSVGIEAGHFDFDFGLFFGIKTATANTINQLQAIGVRIAAPIGTIVYFFIRKSLSAREEAIAAREAAVEAEPAEEAPTEEPAEEKIEEKTEENNEEL